MYYVIKYEMLIILLAIYINYFLLIMHLKIIFPVLNICILILINYINVKI